MIHFEIPKNQSSIIKVIGVGGGGGNAVNYMSTMGIKGVDFVVCNTDSQALTLSPIPNKIQLGPHLTQGLGAGANPDVGRQAGEESIEDISKILKVNTKMVFITAGMGGGTGTGSAPIIAKVCKDLGILTVAIVTTPFSYEGPKRKKQAAEGIALLKEHVDTILIISNDKLRQKFGNLQFSEAFAMADNILAIAAKCITDLITKDGRVNLDFNDVQTVMRNGGSAILGSAEASGENRAIRAVEEALNSPLLNDNDINGAKWILLNVTSSSGEFEHSLDELDYIQGFVQQQAGNQCDIIMGMGIDDTLGDKIAVSIIATGFEQNDITEGYKKADDKREPVILELIAEEPTAQTVAPEPIKNEEKKEIQKEEELFTNALPADITIKKTVENPNLKVIDSSGQLVDNMQVHTTTENIFFNTIIEQKIQQSVTEKTVISDPEVSDKLSIEENNKRFEEQKRELELRAQRLSMLNNKNMDLKNKVEKDNLNHNKHNDPNRELSNTSVSTSGTKKFGLFDTLNSFISGKKAD